MVEADVNGFLREVANRHERVAANILYRLDPKNIDGIPYSELVKNVQGHYSGAQIGHLSDGDDDGMTVSFPLTDQSAGSAFLRRRFDVESGVPDKGTIGVTLTAESFGLDLDRYLAEIIPNGEGWKLRIAGNRGTVPEAGPTEGAFIADVDLEEPTAAQPQTAAETAVLEIGRRYGFEIEQPAAA